MMEDICKKKKIVLNRRFLDEGRVGRPYHALVIFIISSQSMISDHLIWQGFSLGILHDQSYISRVLKT